MTLFKAGDPKGMKGRWGRIKREENGVARRILLVSCPRCGTVGQLDHEVDENGVCTPSVQCPSATCDFHDNVQLADYPQLILGNRKSSIAN